MGLTREVRIAKALADDGNVDELARVEPEKTREHGETGLGGETRVLRGGGE